MTKIQKLAIWARAEGYEVKHRQWHSKTGALQDEMLFIHVDGMVDARLADMIRDEGLAAGLEQRLPTMPSDYQLSLRVTDPNFGVDAQEQLFLEALRDGPII
jgi:hypothetical protein